MENIRVVQTMNPICSPLAPLPLFPFDLVEWFKSVSQTQSVPTQLLRPLVFQLACTDKCFLIYFVVLEQNLSYPTEFLQRDSRNTEQ